MDGLVHVLAQWLSLTLAVGAILALGALCGWGIALALLPLRYALRWVVMAPLLGVAALSAVGVLLSRLGLPAGIFAPWLVAALAACSVLCTIRLGRRHPLLRQGRLWAHVRVRGMRLLGLFLVITTVSAVLTASAGRGSVRDFWGTGDIGAYWGTADYLVRHGGNGAAYDAQTEFRSTDVGEHLRLHARMGCMVFLATVAAVFDREHVLHAVTPTLVAALVLLMGLCAIWLEELRSPAAWPLLVLACNGVLYFLLFFSYLSQATGVMLVLAGFLCGQEALFGAITPGRARRGGLAAGLLIGAGVLHYPSMAPVSAFYLIVLAVAAYRRKNKRITKLITFGCIGLAAAAVSAHYWPATVRELRWLSGREAQQGWDWPQLPGFTEALGLHTLLGYWLQWPVTGWTRMVEVAGGVFMAGGAWLFWRSGRSRVLVAALAGATGLMAAAALVRIAQHVPSATHSYVKVLSMFAPVLLLACLVPWADRLARFRPRRAALLIGTLLAFWIPLELKSLWPGRNGPKFKEPLIELVRRQTAVRGTRVFLDLGLPEQIMAPVVRDVARLAANAGEADVIIGEAGNERLQGAPVVDGAGPYIAIRPLTGGARRR